jgi:hypothetical protein
MNRTIITPRTFFLVGMLIIVLLLGYAVRAAEPKGHKSHKGEKPFSMLVMIQCGHYVSIYVTWNNGEVVGYDVREQDPEGINEWIMTTTGEVAVLQADCTKVGADSK